MRVLLIVSGGIAAYKAPDLVRKLIAVGCEVQVIMTEAAGAFCTELSLATVSGRPVRRSLFDPGEETGSVGHIALADWPALVLVAPATADLMARAAHGLANDLASTVLLATQAPVLWAPAMNTNMWRHPATRANLETLRERGGSFVGPDSGELACGWIGEGRMIDPPLIAEAVRERLQPAVRALEGRRVLVTAGPTRAYLDPVRFISNASTRSCAESASAMRTYSSTVLPKKLQMTAQEYCAMRGSFSAANFSRPTFSSPMALSMPSPDSATRGTGLPRRGSRDNPLVQNPPNWLRSTNGVNSSPYPNVPEAATTGFLRENFPIETDRSGLFGLEITGSSGGMQKG